ncbi:hypothetical protein BASA83_009171 [Batrachochytrium salamandrivorans]|nr:hypothetical protein BASA83_009171 [Batrachochytrium salamandrivorans]
MRIASWLASWKGSNYRGGKREPQAKHFPGPVQAQSSHRRHPTHSPPLPQYRQEPSVSLPTSSTETAEAAHLSQPAGAGPANQDIFSNGCHSPSSSRHSAPDSGNGPVNTYYSRFLQIKADLDWNEAALIHRFRVGLSAQVKNMLLHHEYPKTLEEFALLAIKQTPSQRLPPVSAPTNPMMMDLDATRRGPITPQERDRRFQGKLCFRCGKEGHFRAECPLGARRQVSAVNTLTEFPALTPSISENDHSQ